ncbi:MAG: hypothetical protein ACR2QK_20905 [Acidimicrobiales bacterium]
MRDLTDSSENARVLELASGLLAEHGDRVIELDRAAAAPGAPGDDPVQIEALRCAHSRLALRRALEAGGGPLDLSIVWAMYGETARIRPADEDNPHGEDFLRAKIDQVRWLVDGLDVGWHLVAVDDGCPDSPSSAEVARLIIGDTGLGGRPPGDPPPSDRAPGDRPGEGVTERVTVLELSQVVGRPTSPEGVDLTGLSDGFRRLRSPSQSRKGGSVLYGLWHALSLAGERGERSSGRPTDPGSAAARPHRRRGDRRHVALYTDADLSANLAQTGLLAAPIIEDRASAVVGQRYGIEGAVLVTADGASTEPESTGRKPDKMIVLFRHFVRAVLMPDIANVLDTHAGFKAFDARPLSQVIGLMDSFDETFDVELLVRLTQHLSRSGEPGLAVAPIVFVEDFAQTNFPSIDPGQRHLDMIGQLVAIHDRLVAPVVPPTNETAELLEWVRGLDLDAYVATIERLKAADRASLGRGGADPLFDSRWSLDELQSGAADGALDSL